MSIDTELLDDDIGAVGLQRGDRHRAEGVEEKVVIGAAGKGDVDVAPGSLKLPGLVCLAAPGEEAVAEAVQRYCQDILVIEYRLRAIPMMRLCRSAIRPIPYSLWSTCRHGLSLNAEAGRSGGVCMM